MASGLRMLRVAPSVATQRTMGVAVGVLFVVAGLVGLVSTLIVAPPHTVSGSALAVAAMIAGGVLVRSAARLPRWVLRAVPVSGALVITAAVLLATGTVLAPAYAMLYLFVVIDSFVFFGWAFASAHLIMCAGLHAMTVILTGQPLAEVAVQEVAFGATGAFVGLLVRAASVASVDALTGLIDRSGFDRRIERALRDVASSGDPLSIVLLDLDGFSRINQQRGPERGDEVLVLTARALSRSVGDGGVVCRFGSDEFVVILQGRDPDEVMSAVALMRDAVSPVTFSAAVVRTTPSDTRASLTRRLINALHQAGELGENCAVLVDESDRAAARLQQAIDHGELRVYYQAVVGLPTRGLVAVEALVRWVLDDGTVVPPDEFVPQAERDGSIVRLGRWVMVEACRQCAAWRDLAGLPQQVAVNVSHAELCQPGYAAELLEICALAGVAPDALVIEVTETTLGHEDEHVVTNLSALRAAGVGISIDDFGTGYSSLSRLQEMPMTQLKIDRAFVMHLDAGMTSTPVLVAIVALARAMRLEIVAEGVETPAQAASLEALGVRYGQGYLFARPMPAEDLERAFAVGADVGAEPALILP